MGLKHYNIKIFTLAVFLVVSLCTLAFGKQGTTADFTRAYPWVLLAILTMLTCVLGYLLVEKDKERKEKLKEISDDFAARNADLKEVLNKFDKIINTLFVRDREIETRVANCEKDIATQIKSCEINLRLCQNGMLCFDRRNGDDRRED